ncbi:peptide chain release factor N(5)-glutamine methyltransferase [Mycoplasma sp. Pen4]|uniref:peptide chain release factor N(5)-glutamine methyltransferase n=1 Tax=Mycoplasma sp. Pen4 TaxID=640330 RepID=UPI0016546EE7|nr:peptide chain release factor N(5)-glutamine methyltransferase [Mycoplasma sp. Pen4]QNM93546.1 peptide chain release factor N(5)-glutamine methyltransferase [Mycoplasma sp. Pen4]
MPTIRELLLEKRRYGLEESVSSFEIEQLNKGMPIQKIMGYVELADVHLDLSRKVLIPRYETEELIIQVSEENKNREKLDVLDLCTGSGYIALGLKKKQPTWNIDASDIDLEAIEQTRVNKEINHLDVNIIQSDVFQNINKKYDIIVSNPPYIQPSEKLSKSVTDFEPLHALYAKDDGLYFYKKIIEEAPKHLKPSGVLYFEINPFHIDFWNKLKETYNLTITKDICGKDRFVTIYFK